MKKIKHFIKDSSGDAVVEATILFPIMIMIFAAIVLLAMYLPQRAILQEAAQYAATMLAPEHSDVAYQFDDDNMKIREPWDFNMHNSFSDVVMGTYSSKNNFWSRTFGVYRNGRDWQNRIDDMIQQKISKSVTFKLITAPVNTEVVFRQTLIYAEIEVTVWQEIPMPVDFSFIGFPKTIRIERSVRTSISNGDGFIRSIDDLVYFGELMDRITGIPGDIEWCFKYILPFIE